MVMEKKRREEAKIPNVFGGEEIEGLGKKTDH